jgi:hypothetical protein
MLVKGRRDGIPQQQWGTLMYLSDHSLCVNSSLKNTQKSWQERLEHEPKDPRAVRGFTYAEAA